jgi:hypothetical protein
VIGGRARCRLRHVASCPPGHPITGTLTPAVTRM